MPTTTPSNLERLLTHPKFISLHRVGKGWVIALDISVALSATFTVHPMTVEADSIEALMNMAFKELTLARMIVT